MSRRFPARLLVALLMPLIAGCGQPSTSASPPAPSAQLSNANPASSSPASGFAVFPNVPAYANVTHMVSATVAEGTIGLAGKTVKGVVEVRTMMLDQHGPAVQPAVRAFYRQALPGAGWTAVSDYPGGTLYHQAAADGTNLGLFVAIEQEQQLLIEMMRFEVAGEVEPFALAYASGPERANELFDPQGVALAPDGDHYLVFEREDAIQRYAADGTLKDSWGGAGTEAGQFGTGHLGPQGVAVGPDGSVYVADPANQRVQKFTPDGAFLLAFGAASLDSRLAPALVPFDPKGLAIDAAGVVYVADSTNEHVVLFGPDGQFMTRWPLPKPAGQRSPAADWIAVGPDGRVYVTGSLSDVVNVYAHDGTWLTAWGGSGLVPGYFNDPQGIAVHDNRVYVVDAGNHRVQVFSLDGVLLGLAGSETPSGEPLLYSVAGLAVAADGTLIVADKGASDINVYTPAAGAALAADHPPAAAVRGDDFSPLLPSLPSQAEWRKLASRWLRQEPCAPPCWAGITPGVTTAGEAVALLKQDPMVEPSSVGLLTGTGSHSSSVSYELDWQWVGNDHRNVAHITPGPGLPVEFDLGSDLLASMSAEERAKHQAALEASVVASLTVEFGTYQTDPYDLYLGPWSVLTVGDVIGAYGEPTHAVVYRYPNMTGIWLLYEQLGFVIETRAETPAGLTPSLDASKIMFLPMPSVRFGSIDPDALKAWHGFDAVEGYCTQSESSEPCR